MLRPCASFYTDKTKKASNFSLVVSLFYVKQSAGTFFCSLVRSLEQHMHNSVVENYETKVRSLMMEPRRRRRRSGGVCVLLIFFFPSFRPCARSYIVSRGSDDVTRSWATGKQERKQKKQANTFFLKKKTTTTKKKENFFFLAPSTSVECVVCAYAGQHKLTFSFTQTHTHA